MNQFNSSGDDIARLIVGEEPRFTGDDVARESGVDRATSMRLWRALGFPDAGDTVAYGYNDVEALRVAGGAIQSGLLTEDTAVRLARAVGQTIARLADWQVTTLIEAADNATDTPSTPSGRLRAAMDVADELTPAFEHLVIYAWRRHLAASAARAEDLSETELARLTQTQTVGFADMSRFSVLSNDLEDEHLGSLVETFENLCADQIARSGGRLIKALGDAVLYVFDDPERAAEASLDLISKVAARTELPHSRVGMATGSVISRLGDVFGPPVNLAARLSNVARSNRLLVDDSTGEALGGSFEMRTLPQRRVRGFGTLAPINVMRHRTFRTRDW